MRITPKRGVVIIALSALLLAACSDPPNDDTAGAPLPTPLPAVPTPTPNEAARVVYEVPEVDTATASVDLADVIFDTFGRGPLDLSTATPQERAALLDVIPPLDDPRYIDPATDPWLLPEDPVLGYVDGSGQAFAHPHKILALHEIVNTIVDNQAVLISYCPLCDSGVVFSRFVNIGGTPTELRFSNTSALFDNDLVMVDRQTGSYWFQVAGRAIVGPLTDQAMTVLPSTTMTWRQWQQLYPDTLILTRDLGFDRDYSQDRFAGYANSVDQGRTPFPVNPEALEDNRLTPATRVLLVDSAAEAVAVPVTTEPSVASFELDGSALIVLSVDGAGAAFSAELDGQILELGATADGFVDSASGVIFDLAGSSSDGSVTLTAIPSRSSFWFAAVAAFPDVQVITPGFPS